MYNEEDYNNMNYQSEQATPQPEESQTYAQTETAQTYTQSVDRKAMKAAKKAARIQARTNAMLANGGKKPHGKFFKAVAAVVCAVLLGGIAGGACYGVSYAGYTIFPIESKTAGNTTDTTPATQVNNTTVNNSANNNISATVMDVSDIVSSVISSVVAINGKYTQSVDYGFFGSQSQQYTVSGSGIIIGTNDDELLIVTNAHVIDGVEDISVTFYDGSEVSASVKGSKSAKDLAVLAVKLSDIPSDAVYTIATLGDSSDIKVGEAAIAVGNSLGYGISVTTGCISATGKTVTVDDTEYTDLIQTDAAINPGNSGGALFNAAGEVIGINSVKMTNTQVEGMGYAISISSVKDIIDELSLEDTKNKLSDDERGYLGITGVSITDTIAQTYGYPVGILIRSITDGAAADNAGLVKNDILTSFDGETVTTIDELVSMMSYYAVGDKVEITYYHMNSKGEYEKQTTTVTLTEKPAE